MNPKPQPVVRVGCSRALTFAMVALALLLPARADAATQIFTTNTAISDRDFSFEGDDIIVRGCTVTIDGAHTFASLTVERNGSNQPGVVTHTANFSNRGGAGMWLTVTGDVIVEGASRALVASAINVAGKGHASASGVGAGGSFTWAAGGGHGGAGGDSNNGALGGGTYGGFAQPTTMGSGGGNDTNCACGGGVGGGVIRLTIGGALTVDGSINANGSNATSNEGGGGAGGSIWIECADFSGNGLITANGGTGFNLTVSGGGGGGRIAIETGTSSFLDTNIRAYGGAGWATGGAGTVWLNVATESFGTLIVDNGGISAEVTEFTGESAIGNLLVRNGGRIGPVHQDASMHLMMEGDVNVQAGGSIYANTRGHAGAEGLGAGGGFTWAAGGGHGGAGGNSANGASGGGTYGDFAQPTTMGSGGGNDTNCGCGGGAGGGVIRLTIGGVLTVDGAIDANGSNAATNEGGGGAGGSIWIECASLFGAGTIHSNGNPGGNATVSGGGGGGRIAIYSCAVEMPLANITSNGGAGPGAAGTGDVGTVGIFSDTVDFQSSPESIVVDRGDSAVFKVSASGQGVVTFQWYFEGEPLVDGPGISGATTDTLTLTDITCAANAGNYRLAVMDNCGIAFSEDASLEVFIFANLNGDCVVDGADFGILLSDWGLCADCLADLNNDGLVDGADLGLLLGSWTG